MRLPIMRPLFGFVALGCSTFLLFACKGTDLGVTVDPGTVTGVLAGAANDLTASYLILDLASGSHTSTNVLADPSLPAYRQGKMVFKRVPGPGGGYFLGIFEVTIGQWNLIAPVLAKPWTSGSPTEVPAAVVGGTTALGDTFPAFALSYDDVTAGLGTYQTAHGVTLMVPTVAQWTTACAAGSAGAWSWGSGAARTDVQPNAVVFETLTTFRGPQPVGSLAPNAFGFYDMHGNVWEWNAPGATIRGGSWHDPVELAKTANQPDFADTQLGDYTQHALVGVRLIIVP